MPCVRVREQSAGLGVGQQGREAVDVVFSYQLQDAQDRVRVPALVRRIALGSLADLGSDARLELLVGPLQKGQQLAHDHADGAAAANETHQ